MFRPEMVINNHKEIKMIFETFLKKSISKHGDIYGFYPDNIYNPHNEFFVECKCHGKFFTNYKQFMDRSLGCPYCTKLKTFIDYMNEKFPNKYDFSLVGRIESVLTVVKLICNDCGDILEKSVNGHMYGGCLSCYNKHRTEILRTYDFPDFKNSMDQKYGPNRFLLDESTFKNYQTKTKIICCICGETYYKTPSALLGTTIIPCDKCELSRKQSDFIKVSTKLFNGVYDYSSVVYVGSKQKVKIWCKTCKKYFEQTPNQHLHGPKNGGGCPVCSLISRTTSCSVTSTIKPRFGGAFSFAPKVPTDRLSSTNRDNPRSGRTLGGGTAASLARWNLPSSALNGRT